MTEERKYNEKEVTEIFSAAARENKIGERALVSADGLTLAELQTIGSEVGLAPARVAEEAAALDTDREASVRTTRLGIPIGVGRSVDLARAPSDREWETLVAEIREIFGAQGKIVSHGSLREWRNGNLHVSVEPTATGNRLRLGTLKSSSAAMMGMVGIAMGLFFLVVGFTTGDVTRILPFVGLFGGVGAVAMTSAVASLPRWAGKRDEQMAYIAARAQALLGSEPDEEVLNEEARE